MMKKVLILILLAVLISLTVQGYQEIMPHVVPDVMIQTESTALPRGTCFKLNDNDGFYKLEGMERNTSDFSTNCFLLNKTDGTVLSSNISNNGHYFNFSNESIELAMGEEYCFSCDNNGASRTVKYLNNGLPNEFTHINQTCDYTGNHSVCGNNPRVVQAIYLKNYTYVVPTLTKNNNYSTYEMIGIYLNFSMPANSSVQYGKTGTLDNGTETNSSLLRATFFGLHPLDSNTTYYYNVTVCNKYDLCAEYGYFGAFTGTTPTTYNPIMQGYYNLSNLTNADSISEIAIFVNDGVGGVLFSFAILAIFFVILLSLMRWGFIEALLTSSFIGFVLSGILAYGGLVIFMIPLMFLLLTALTGFFMYVSKR